MRNNTRTQLDIAWSAFGDMLRRAAQDAHTAAVHRASVAAAAAAAGSSTPAVYGALFTATFRSAYEAAYGEELARQLPL